MSQAFRHSRGPQWAEHCGMGSAALALLRESCLAQKGATSFTVSGAGSTVLEG